MADLIGQTLGQYKLTARLGRGGMADVYKAFHTGLSIYRAIKVIRPEFVSSDDFRIRFKKEAQAVASLRHPNIVQMHDFGSEGDIFYMVMEFVEGTDLKALLKKEGRIRPISKAVDIIRQIASALEYAHKRDLIHRDIKPDNIMLNNEGLPILMDFGIAKLLTESTQLTQTGLGIGTPAYMAPEQAKAIGELGPTADVYSLSIVLFEMLTGKQPFSADTPMAVMLKVISDPIPLPRSISSDISETLEGIILKGTAKDPKDRYSSTKLLYEALENYVNVDSEQATLVREAPRIAESAPTGKGRYAAIAVVLLLVAAGITYMVSKDPATIINQATSTIPAQPAVNQAASGLLAEYNGPTDAGVVLTKPVDVSQGDVLYLNVIASNPITDFVLESADGRTRLFSSYGDFGPVTVKQSGQMQLSILTRAKKAGNIDYQLWRLNPPIIPGKDIQPGIFSSGETLTPGQALSYSVDLSQGDTIFFDLEKSSNTTDFSLTTPDGRKDVFKSYADQGPLTAPVTGRYTLLADPRGAKLTSFEFTLYKLETADKEGGPIQAGKYVSGSTEISGQTITYHLDLSVGDVIFFDVEKASATTDFSLTAEGARKPLFKSYADQGPLQIVTAGNHTLKADPRGDKLSTFEFTLYKLTPPQIEGGTIELGEFAQGATDLPGQTVGYNINLTKGETISLDVESTSATTDFILTAPGARKPLFKSYGDTGPLTVESSGSYSLVADPRGNSVSEFEFVIRGSDATRAP